LQKCLGNETLVELPLAQRAIFAVSHEINGAAKIASLSVKHFRKLSPEKKV